MHRHIMKDTESSLLRRFSAAKKMDQQEDGRYLSLRVCWR